MRKDPKATQSNNSLTTKENVHKVDSAIKETIIFSQTTLAKSRTGTQYMGWKDEQRKVTFDDVAKDFETRRASTPEEDQKFQASKKMQNNVIYRKSGLTKEQRFTSENDLKPPKSLLEKMQENIKKNNDK